MTAALFSRLTGLRHSPQIPPCASGPGWFRGKRQSALFDRYGRVHAEAGLRIWKRFAQMALGEDVEYGQGGGLGRAGRNPSDPARLRMGGHTIIGNRTHIHGQASNLIDTRGAISWDIEILDASRHTIVAEDGQALPNQAPAAIEDRSWIETRALIFKSVPIGHDPIEAAAAKGSGFDPLHRMQMLPCGI